MLTSNQMFRLALKRMRNNNTEIVMPTVTATDSLKMQTVSKTILALTEFALNRSF